MVKKLVADSVLQSYQVFAMTSSTKDLDNKLGGALSSLTLDMEGKLVRSMSLRESFKIFEPIFDTFLNEWMENCKTSGRFNWRLFGQIVQVSITLLNIISQIVQSLMELNSVPTSLPDFDGRLPDDSDSTYDAVMNWALTLLTHNPKDDVEMIAMDIQSHRNIKQEFPCQMFLEQLFNVTQLRFERLQPKLLESRFLIMVSSITSALETFKDAIQPHQMKLLQSYNLSIRRSPKRRTYSVTTSECGSSPDSKRRRLSASIASASSMPSSPPQMHVNGRQTPSPTNSTISLVPTETSTTAAPPVTVAMLRALTRDLKKKYGA
jgi:hypothetical protein